MCIDPCKFYCRHPEFFYPSKFVTVKSAKTHNNLDISVVSTVCHGTHLNEVKEICIAPNIASFVGKEKKWRPGTEYSKDEQTFDRQYCSYVVEGLGNEPKPMTKHEQWAFGPFLWFGTNTGEADIYGDYCFEFQLKSVLREYQQSRGSKNPICYRVGGTLLYKEEITHAVIICCEDDQDCKSYPLIEAANTKYFNPPKVERIEPPMCKKRKLDQKCFSTEESKQSSKEIFIPAMASRNTDLEKNRHEHVALAFYMPHGTTLQLTNEDGKLCDIVRDHYKYCVKSTGKYKQCQLSQPGTSYIHDFNIPFDYSTFLFDHLHGQ